MIYIDEAKLTFHLFSETFGYYLQVVDGQLLNLYYGAPLCQTMEQAAAIDLTYTLPAYPAGASFELKPQRLPFEVPTNGTGWYGTPAVQAVTDYGDTLTDLRYAGYRIHSEKPEIPGLPSTHEASGQEAKTLEIVLTDSLTHLEAHLFYTIIGTPETGYGLSRRLQLTNRGTGPLTLTHMASASVPLPFAGSAGKEDVVHLKGAWARERRMVRTPLGGASQKVESQRGASGHEENPFLALCEPSTTEFSGAVYAMNLVYSGSFQAVAERRDTVDFLSIGLNPETHSWLLKEGESFYTPEAVLVYSGSGFNGMSHIFHGIYRQCLGNSPWIHRERPVLINNWEAMYFDLNEEKILQLARTAKDLGVELLVLDDGWFGKRNDDTSSLGDWVENPEKLPLGLSHLALSVNELGLTFGLWVEPEMISPDSDLYRQHPDWCLHVPGRKRTQGRNQLILDLSREDVQEYLIQTLTRLLSSAPIGYIKWDMNRNMTESFSALLPPERQKETQHRYMLGLYRVVRTVTETFPKVLFESCSGGGGRFDAGMLSYMPQTWTSDDSDAVERLKIQYGTSLVYPISSMGAHISAVPNHQVGRITPMQVRADVALSGNFGLELDPAILSESDIEVVRQSIQRVKRLRHLTAFGIYDRLLSPFDGNYTAWQFHNESEVLLCAFRVLSEPNPLPPLVRLVGLEPQSLYEREDGAIFTGETLMKVGLPLIMESKDFTSCLMYFRKSKKG